MKQVVFQKSKFYFVKKLLIVISVFGIGFNAFADNNPTPPVPSGFEQDTVACQVSESGVVPGQDGKLLVGTIVGTPWYVSGKPAPQSTVILSHTHVLIAPLGDTNPSDEYEMAADNVFATGYDSSEPLKEVPTPLNSLTNGIIVEACGFTYTQKPSAKSPATQGIHWVHIKDATETTGGWVKIVSSSGEIGANLENNTEYLYLWPTVSAH